MAIIDFFNIPVCAECVALAASLLTFRRKEAANWRLFTFFLLLTLVTEAAGFYIENLPGKPSNFIVYNGFMLIQLCFYCYLFFTMQGFQSYRLPLIITALCFVIFFMAEAFNGSKAHSLFSTYQRNSRLFLSVIMIIYSCLFFYIVLKNDALKSPLHHPLFWIITGLFFYYFGSIVLFAFKDEVRALRLSGNQFLYELVTGVLSIILYTCWSIGFIWEKKRATLYRQSL